MMLPATLRRTATALVALPLLASAAAAQVVYSGVLNLTILNSNAGRYVNVVDGTTFGGPTLYPDCPGPGCNFDFNLFASPAGWFLYAPGVEGQAPAVTVDQRGYVADTPNGNPLDLAVGTIVGASSTFNTAEEQSAAALVGGAPAIFGFRFRNEGPNTLHYGWARVQLVNGQPGTLVDYAYEATAGASIAAGAGRMAQVVPEPTTVALVAGGLAVLGGVATRRRRVV